MKIVIGSDKSGFSLKEAVKKHLIDARTYGGRLWNCRSGSCKTFF